tara:strand:+ start:913 stop:1185 length:273 start_codon:yes stop_codon:yes gene_type:complete
VLILSIKFFLILAYGFLINYSFNLLFWLGLEKLLCCKRCREPMPINLILEDLGSRFYTVRGKDLTNNIRSETIFFPSTIDVMVEPINCLE